MDNVKVFIIKNVCKRLHDAVKSFIDEEGYIPEAYIIAGMTMESVVENGLIGIMHFIEPREFQTGIIKCIRNFEEYKKMYKNDEIPEEMIDSYNLLKEYILNILSELQKNEGWITKLYNGIPVVFIATAVSNKAKQFNKAGIEVVRKAIQELDDSGIIESAKYNGEFDVVVLKGGDEA